MQVKSNVYVVTDLDDLSDINEEYNQYKGTHMERECKDVAIEKCGFFLPEFSYFDFINDVLDDARKTILVKTAMENIKKKSSNVI